MRNRTYRTILFLLFCGFILLPVFVDAQTALPKVSVEVAESDNPSDLVPTLQIVLLLTVLSLAPSILIMMTSFTRIVVVFHFLRQSLATQTVPSNQILVGLALFITFFVMKPVLTEICFRESNAVYSFVNRPTKPPPLLISIVSVSSRRTVEFFLTTAASFSLSSRTMDAAY